MRELLCLRGSKLRRFRCRAPAKLDAIAHHPYAVSGPRKGAFRPDDISVADVSRLVRVLRAAEKARTVRPARRKRLWITELSWDSNPPDPDGVPEARRARWVADAFYLLWRQGVDTITWFQLIDSPEGRGYPYTIQAGLFSLDGRPKLSSAVFRFPFVAERENRARVRIGGRRRVGPRWRSSGSAEAAGRRWPRCVRAALGSLPARLSSAAARPCALSRE